MPNWSTNTIAVKGKKADVINWLNVGLMEINKVELKDIKVSVDMVEQIIADVLNGAKLTLDSFNPMPQTFLEFDTTNTKRTFDAWLTKGFMDEYNKYSPLLTEDKVRNNLMDYYLDKGIILKDLDNNELCKVREEAARAKFPQYLADYEKYSQEYDAAARYQKKTYGIVGWYDWGIQCRGTKWDAKLEDWSVIENGDELIIYTNCETAWCYPSGWLGTMQTRYNNLSFFCRAIEESGMYNGFFSARNMKEDMWIENDTDVWDNARDKVEEERGDEFDEDNDYDAIEELVEQRNEELNDLFDNYVHEYSVEEPLRAKLTYKDDDSNTSDIIACME